MKSKILRKVLYPILRALIVPLVASMVMPLLTKLEKKMNTKGNPFMKHGMKALRTLLSRILK